MDGTVSDSQGTRMINMQSFLIWRNRDRLSQKIVAGGLVLIGLEVN